MIVPKDNVTIQGAGMDKTVIRMAAGAAVKNPIEGEFLRQEHERPVLLVASFINPHDLCYMAIDAWTTATKSPRMYPKSSRERQCLAEALRLPPGVPRADFFDRLPLGSSEVVGETVDDDGQYHTYSRGHERTPPTTRHIAHIEQGQDAKQGD